VVRPKGLESLSILDVVALLLVLRLAREINRDRDR
jgi:hypothetical protein